MPAPPAARLPVSNGGHLEGRRAGAGCERTVCDPARPCITRQSRCFGRTVAFPACHVRSPPRSTGSRLNCRVMQVLLARSEPATPLTQDPGMPERVAPGLGPHAQPVRPISDGNRRAEATGASVDTQAPGGSQPESFASASGVSEPPRLHNALGCYPLYLGPRRVVARGRRGDGARPPRRSARAGPSS